jgi:phage terminase Nu1 subunit (DNA packaging protein)
MDQEIASLKLNINQLAGITGVHRQTVAARLKNVYPAPGSNAKLKLFSVTDVLTELMIPTVSGDVAEMTPSDRLAHWKAENERLSFEESMGQLIPAEDVAREFSVMAKAVVQVLETLPDVLERDCALPPSAVMRVQNIIDDLRDQIAQKVIDAELEEETSEED